MVACNWSTQEPLDVLQRITSNRNGWRTNCVLCKQKPKHIILLGIPTVILLLNHSFASRLPLIVTNPLLSIVTTGIVFLYSGVLARRSRQMCFWWCTSFETQLWSGTGSNNTTQQLRTNSTVCHPVAASTLHYTNPWKSCCNPLDYESEPNHNTGSTNHNSTITVFKCIYCFCWVLATR